MDVYLYVCLSVVDIYCMYVCLLWVYICLLTCSTGVEDSNRLILFIKFA